MFILYLFIFILFSILIFRLFNLQIINGANYNTQSRNTVSRIIDVPAARGNIYDRYGRPVAVNNQAFTVNFDPSSNVTDLNVALYNFILLMEKNNEIYIDEMPISKEEPFVFLFDSSLDDEIDWKKNMALDGITPSPGADKTIELLRERFKIDQSLSNEEARKIISLRSTIYMQRYYQYEPITFAYDVSDKTIVEIEEQNDKYQGFFIDKTNLRHYPYAKYLAHIVGYTGKLTSEDVSKDTQGSYKSFDSIGKSGIEFSFENLLKGVNGKNIVQVTSLGKRLGQLSTENLPIKGSDLFLTIDAQLQKESYDILEEVLTEVLKNKLLNRSYSEPSISIKQGFAAMITSNLISLELIMNSTDESSTSFNIKNYLNSKMQDGLNLKELLIQGLDLGEVSEYDMIHILVEQGIVSADHDYVDDIDNRKISVLSFIIDKMDEKEITPQMLGLDPSTGSVIITKVNTGEVLAAVSYPSYDSNELVNTINASYFSRLMNDTTTPMINRVFMERRAPGSSFKMITAMTALDKGVITPLSTIKDEIVFTKAGLPYTRSWSTRSQGVLNVSSALEVSSNYFFAESAYRLGNQKNNNKLDSINAMNEFMIKFGLNDRSGVEIGEAYDFVQDEGVLNISSPELMRQKEDREWFDGDTVKTAIGQSLNSYTPANMVKYIATLASKGYRYALRLVDKTESPDGFIDVHQAKLEEELDFNASYLSAIEKGMLRVVEGSRGTARAFFNDFPYRIAAKTGTAQENLKRNDHTIFTGYFPVEDPQIAIYVLIPFGDTKTTSAPAAMVAERILYEYVGLNNTSQTKPNYNSLLE